MPSTYAHLHSHTHTHMQYENRRRYIHAAPSPPSSVPATPSLPALDAALPTPADPLCAASAPPTTTISDSPETHTPVGSPLQQHHHPMHVPHNNQAPPAPRAIPSRASGRDAAAGGDSSNGSSMHVEAGAAEVCVCL